jgi:tetratricopeptide (TPR) repeat protein
MSVSPAKAHRLLGQIDEKSGDFDAAEIEFKAAVDAQRSADSYVDLAQFYLGRKQFDRAATAVQTAAKLDHPRGPATVDAAAILISEDHLLPFAEQLLREYLVSSAKSDGAPAFKVRIQLGNLLAQRGDTTNARVEYDLALALSSKYAPALRARDQAPPQTASQRPRRTTNVNAIP